MDLQKIIEGAKDKQSLIEELKKEIQWMEQLADDRGNNAFNMQEWNEYGIAKALVKYLER